MDAQWAEQDCMHDAAGNEGEQVGDDQHTKEDRGHRLLPALDVVPMR